MADTTDRTGGLKTGYVALGVVLAVGSVLIAVWALLNNEISTGLSMLLYVLVGALLIGIGTSPRPKSDPE